MHGQNHIKFLNVFCFPPRVHVPPVSSSVVMTPSNLLPYLQSTKQSATHDYRALSAAKISEQTLAEYGMTRLWSNLRS